MPYKVTIELKSGDICRDGDIRDAPTPQRGEEVIVYIGDRSVRGLVTGITTFPVHGSGAVKSVDQVRAREV